MANMAFKANAQVHIQGDIMYGTIIIAVFTLLSNKVSL